MNPRPTTSMRPLRGAEASKVLARLIRLSLPYFKRRTAA
jgi:hypothetical protein